MEPRRHAASALSLAGAAQVSGRDSFFCEGEKDADRLATLDLTATTISGSTTWTPELAKPLRGRDVIILVDNDDARRSEG